MQSHELVNSGLPAGKAPLELLAGVFGSRADARLLQGPGVGADAALALLEDGRRTLALAADPITFVGADPAVSARLAVSVNANDILAVGAEPEWLLATVLAPIGADADALRDLLDALRSACDDAGIALVGGHTEATDAVSRTVLSCAVIGSAPTDRIIRSDGAQAGDALIQAGALAVEGTAILGHPQLLEAPGVSIAAAARALRDVSGVHAMHDVTEAGVSAAALELAAAAGLDVELDAEALLWLPQTLAVCAERGLDPLGLLGSGTLLAAVSASAADMALSALAEVGVRAARIGRLGASDGGRLRATINRGGQSRPLPRFARDEALRAMAAAQAGSDSDVEEQM